QTPNDFILTIRLKKGALMLRNNPELNVTEISDKIGFSSPRYFSKCFKDVYQVSPLGYRKGEG
ncbi:helix-turn-helix domain-containing protein, partial [Bacteroides heparinolyticus]